MKHILTITLLLACAGFVSLTFAKNAITTKTIYLPLSRNTMKTTLFFLFALCAVLAFAANPDSSNARLVDWLDAPSNYDFEHVAAFPGYTYSGIYRWDLAMGDSFLVWLPGTDRILFLDAYDSTDVDTIANFVGSSVDAVGAAIDDSVIYILGGGGALGSIYDIDSLILKDGVGAPGADYCYAVVEDSFLYTCDCGDMNPTGIACINIANPESIFIYRTIDYYLGNAGLEVIDGHAFVAEGGFVFTDPYGNTYWYLKEIDMLGPDSAVYDTGIVYEHRCLGDIASNDSLVFYVNTYVGMDFPFNPKVSNLFVWERDYTHQFDSTRWFGQGVFGVDVVADRWIAVGFEHGFSILDISDLSGIEEVAHYRHPDSTMDFTHFALKEDRLYAMGHPRYKVARLYMFELDEEAINGQTELHQLPKEFRFYNYPNPFNSSCRFAFSGVCEPIKNIEIYDINGRLVDTITPPAGGIYPAPTVRELRWQPDISLPSGIYLARVKIGDKSYTSKLVYLE